MVEIRHETNNSESIFVHENSVHGNSLSQDMKTFFGNIEVLIDFG